MLETDSKFTCDIDSELAIDNITYDCCGTPQKTEYNVTPKDNTILFLIIIFLMILFSGGLWNRYLGYTVCDGGYNW